MHVKNDFPLQDQSKPYDSKKNVWLPDAEEVSDMN